MNNAKTITKAVVRILVRSSISGALGNIVANNRNTSDVELVDKYHETAAFVGGAAVGWYVSEPVAVFAETKVEDAFAWFNTTFNKA